MKQYPPWGKINFIQKFPCSDKLSASGRIFLRHFDTRKISISHSFLTSLPLKRGAQQNKDVIGGRGRHAVTGASTLETKCIPKGQECVLVLYDLYNVAPKRVLKVLIGCQSKIGSFT